MPLPGWPAAWPSTSFGHRPDRRAGGPGSGRAQAEEGDRRRIALRLTPAGVRIVAEADHMLDAYISLDRRHPSQRGRAAALGSLELWGHALSNFHQQRATSP